MQKKDDPSRGGMKQRSDSQDRENKKRRKKAPGMGEQRSAGYGVGHPAKTTTFSETIQKRPTEGQPMGEDGAKGGDITQHGKGESVGR
jgi:hypothetical protein